MKIVFFWLLFSSQILQAQTTLRDLFPEKRTVRAEHSQQKSSLHLFVRIFFFQGTCKPLLSSKKIEEGADSVCQKGESTHFHGTLPVLFRFQHQPYFPCRSKFFSKPKPSSLIF